MSKIRNFAKENGFEIVGKLHKCCDLDRNTRFYMDEAENEYLLNKTEGTITIITADGGVI